MSELKVSSAFSSTIDIIYLSDGSSTFLCKVAQIIQFMISCSLSYKLQFGTTDYYRCVILDI